jgi:hypothetical protein
MHHVLNSIIFVAVGVMLSAAATPAGDLASYRWKNRILLVFSPSESDPDFAAFNRSVERERPEVKDRDLVVFRLFEKAPSRVEQQPLQPEEADRLRRRFGVRTGRLTVILIGKDGGVKWEREHRATLKEIFDRIDSMPMRRQEMKQKRQQQ